MVTNSDTTFISFVSTNRKTSSNKSENTLWSVEVDLFDFAYLQFIAIKIAKHIFNVRLV